ncbi:hypothetical protein AQUCO_01100044v1 [Aquilegia coerulea]|uniref:Uncharacterized protein n=1 Tax=Aquilegia coerulea TaxID=218851 RepID=A0A2G5E5A4_AQUCA|nr:hypothetical protein AQUCO_01100044v1 [Aquilegia coerulea]
MFLMFSVPVCLAQFVPANFVFGDSLAEVGNNHYILTLSRSDFVPNGIDFGRPTGRFTNGRTIIDIIGQEFGFTDFTPPYYAPTTTGNVVLRGVNYASGGGGILNFTGYVFGGRINLNGQLDNFANTRQDIISNIGAPATLQLFSKSIFSVTIGSNDFINNYLSSDHERKLVSPEAFVDAMIYRYRIQLTRLYTLGARKIVLANVGPIGCIPYSRDMNPFAGDDCIAFPNQLASLFNTRLKPLVRELNAKLKGSLFVYADVNRIVLDIIQNFRFYGFENPTSACCRAASITIGGRFGGKVPCLPTNKVCPDRSKYVFWDAFHPSEAANMIIARRLLDGGSTDIFPVNVRQLARASLQIKA